MKTEKLQLPSGSDFGEGPDGKRVCRGALMGRPDIIPDCVTKMNRVKLRLEKLPLVDSDYDKAGSYWGYTAGTDIYCAWGTPINEITGNPFPPVQIFVRAKTRAEAKGKVREILPSARFYH